MEKSDAIELSLPRRSNPRQPRGFYKKEKAENAKSLLLESKGIRETARVTGLAKGTVIRIKKYLNNHENGGDEKMEGSKVCNVCGKVKPIVEFSKNSTTHDGLERFCKKCAKAKRQNYKKQRRPKQGKKGKSRDYKHEYEVRIRNKSGHAPKNSELPSPITDAITIDAQLIKAVKKSAVTEFIKKDLIPTLEKLIQERFE